ncbi:MAG: hypothetical protein A3G34_03430 [Candidatus Lindowbacteria bacterium RIFCSPLOWO2_12_FULL_62_27]|nr:MAG: hypothetical protein A3I06_06985 [Candidatus Lindowbacteria bacterium RIFCSPLOWO2_02_FULL_62_12]OGH62996.1 MAG: hypothetical protein A3G34_03430 [Candidatus Lindowbacteria bacterium RIFCSPLOWO2_12_FULL_62_27]
MAILMAGAALAVLRAHPPALPAVYTTAQEQRQPRSAGPESAGNIRTIAVIVTGEVERAGPIKLIEGTRLKGLFEIVRPRPNAYIDHADYTRALQDGDEVHVPANLRMVAGRVALSDDALQRVRIRSTAAPGGALAGEAGPPKININRASAEALQTLPRIGPETARRIVADRDTRGPFRKKEDLMRVRGVGRKTYKWLEALITVD